MSEADDIREFMGLARKGKNDGKIRTFAEFVQAFEEIPASERTKEIKRATSLVKMCAANEIDIHELCDRCAFDQEIRSKLVRLKQNQTRSKTAPGEKS